MKHTFTTLAASVAAVTLMSQPALGQVDVRAPFVRVKTRGAVPAAPVRVQGQIVRIMPDNSAVVRTPDGAETIVYYGPTATYRVNGRDVVFSQLAPGTPVDLYYTVDQNRNILVPAAPVTTPVANAPATTVLQGQLTLTNTNPPAILLVTGDGRQIPLTFDGSAPTTVTVETRGDRNVVRSLSAALPPAQATLSVRGKVVRVEPGYVVVRTPEGRDAVIYTDPNTTYTIENRNGVVDDIKEGAEVTAHYTVQGARWVGHKIVHGVQRILP